MNPKNMKPTMMPVNRYIVYNIISDEDIEFNEVSKAINIKTKNFLGDLEMSETMLWVMKDYDKKSKTGLIRCKNTYVEKIRCVLALIGEIGEIKCIIRVRGVTGTIESAKDKYSEDTNIRKYL